MWCLENLDGLSVYILPNEKRSFGKSLADIKLENDPTVSRIHAIISIEPGKDSNYKCVVTDLSKYGTYVIQNNEKKKISSDKKYILESGDKIQFGLKQSIFTVSCYFFVIARSSLDEEEIDRLTYITNKFHGKLTEMWQTSCTHLTVPKQVLFTMKLACALASAKPIVTIEYWEAVNTAIKKSEKLPKFENFLPSVKEEWLHVNPELFLPNEERKTLFKGLFFIQFCTKQYFSHVQLIVAAGGKSCVYPTKKPLTPKDLTARNAIVLRQPASDSSQFTQVIPSDYPIIHQKLQALKRRIVSDTEIPLAILYCSTEKYCNPKFDFGTLLKSTNQTSSHSGVVIVDDTQNVLAPSKRGIISNKSEQQHIPVIRNDNKHNSKKDIPFNVNDQPNISVEIFPVTAKPFIPETCEIVSENNILDKRNVPLNIDKEQHDFTKNYNSQKDTIIKNIYTREINKKEDNSEPSSTKRNNIDICNFRKKNITNINKQQDVVILSDENCDSQRNSLKISQLFEIDNNINNDVTKKNMIIDSGFGSSCSNDKPLNNQICNAQSKEESTKMKRKQSQLDESQESDTYANEKYNTKSIAKDTVASNSEHKSPSTKRSKKISFLVEESDSDNDIFLDILSEETSQKNRSKVVEDWHNSPLNKHQSNPLFSFHKSGKKYDEIEDIRETGSDRYRKYSDQQFSNEILRKHVPSGKIFKKAPFLVPERIFNKEDFVL